MKKLLLFLSIVLISSTIFSQSSKKLTLYDDGNKKELLNYYDGYLDGKCVAWDEDGTMIAKVYYVDGMKHGKWYMWHADGTPAYQLRYNKNRKVGIWKFYDESGELIGEKEYDPIYERSTTILLGTFNLSDLSISVTQRLNKNKPFVVGGEYSTYITDGETEDFDDFEKFSKHCILGTAGVLSDGWGMLLKAGTYFGNDHDEYLNEINYVKFDYGWELFLIMKDEAMHIAPVCGIGVTKGMGVQFKFGVNF